MHPGGEHTAALESAELVQHAQQRFLGHLLHQGRKEGIIRGKPAREGIGQAFFDNVAKIVQSGIMCQPACLRSESQASFVRVVMMGSL